MAAAGQIEKKRRQVRPEGALPPVLVLRVTGADAERRSLGRAGRVGGRGRRPRILILARRDDPALGAGDRLLGRMTPAGRRPTRRWPPG